MRDYWIQLEELDIKLLPGLAEMGIGGWRALRGVPCWQGLCGHTHFQQGLNMTLLFQNGLLIYIHQALKGLSCLLK